MPTRFLLEAHLHPSSAVRLARRHQLSHDRSWPASVAAGTSGRSRATSAL